MGQKPTPRYTRESKVTAARNSLSRNNSGRENAPRNSSAEDRSFRANRNSRVGTQASNVRSSHSYATRSNQTGSDRSSHAGALSEVAAAQPRNKLIALACIIAIIGIVAAFAIASCSSSKAPSSDASAAGQDSSFTQSARDVSAQGGTSSTGNAAASTAASSASNGDLSWRDSDFAVDPNRKDWNFEGNGRKTVYLTIDDGPSERTAEVLDILDKYGVKATFFVVGLNPEYYPMIKEAYDRGHTIGLHSMSHEYSTVYSSPDAFFADLDEIGQVVKDQIGYVPCFMRFPGGSSNGISADYSVGIMSNLVNLVQERGYQYYDWNVSSGDGSDHSTEEIIGYSTEPTEYENIVFLCHDSAHKQTTVAALPAIIEHYQALGYTFEAIDRSTYVCHHGVSN